MYGMYGKQITHPSLLYDQFLFFFFFTFSASASLTVSVRNQRQTKILIKLTTHDSRVNLLRDSSSG